MNNIPDFFQTLCRKKQIYNASVEDLLFYFPPDDNGHRIIMLDNFDCICVGYINGIKECRRFRICKCNDIPLLGIHEILMDNVIIKVDSLTYFKKEILKFEDFVSFDKSTFLLLEDKQKVFRLHTIRERIQLPLLKGGFSFKPEIEIASKTITYMKVTALNEEDLIENLTNSFLNVYDQLEEDKIHRFGNIVESVFSKIINYIFKQNVDSVYEWVSENIEIDKLLN